MKFFLEDTLCSTNIFNSYKHYNNKAPHSTRSEDVEGIGVVSSTN